MLASYSCAFSRYFCAPSVLSPSLHAPSVFPNCPRNTSSMFSSMQWQVLVLNFFLCMLVELAAAATIKAVFCPKFVGRTTMWSYSFLAWEVVQDPAHAR